MTHTQIGLVKFGFGPILAGPKPGGPKTDCSSPSTLLPAHLVTLKKSVRVCVKASLGPATLHTDTVHAPLEFQVASLLNFAGRHLKQASRFQGSAVRGCGVLTQNDPKRAQTWPRPAATIPVILFDLKGLLSLLLQGSPDATLQWIQQQVRSFGR